MIMFSLLSKLVNQLNDLHADSAALIMDSAITFRRAIVILVLAVIFAESFVTYSAMSFIIPLGVAIVVTIAIAPAIVHAIVPLALALVVLADALVVLADALVVLAHALVVLAHAGVVHHALRTFAFGFCIAIVPFERML